MPAPFNNPGGNIDVDIVGAVDSFDPLRTGSGIKRWLYRGEWRADNLKIDMADKLAARAVERWKLAINAAPAGLVGRVIDTLIELFIHAAQDQVKPGVTLGAYVIAETIRQALLKINTTYADHNRKDNLVLALIGFQQANANAYRDLLWADSLSTDKTYTLRDWFVTNWMLDLYLPLLDGADTFAQNILQPRLQAQELQAFNDKVRAKLRYGDLDQDDMIHADLNLGLYAVAAECLSSDRIEHLLAPLPLKQVCLLLACAFREGRPYKFLREGGYRISQAVLRMIRGQANHPFQNVPSQNAARDLEHFILSLRSNFYTDARVATALSTHVQPHNALTDIQLSAFIDALEISATQAANNALVTFVTTATPIGNQLPTLLNTLQTSPDESSKKAHKVLNGTDVFTWLRNWNHANAAGQHIFTEFLRIFGFRALDIPELNNNNDPKNKTLAYYQILSHLQELSQLNQLQAYLTGLQGIIFAVPTADKELKNFTYIESLLENIQQLLDTINYPPVSYSRSRAQNKPANRVKKLPTGIVPATPLHTNNLQAFPLIVIDQSDVGNQAIFQSNGQYLLTLQARFNATIHHVSMRQVMQFSKDLDIAEMFATTVHETNIYWQGNQPVQNLPRAGFGGARNIVFIVATAFHRALKRPQNPVQNFPQLIALPQNQRQQLIGDAISNHTQVMMGDDDLTLMPGFLHAKALLANKFRNSYWKIVTRMMGRTTTKVPSTAAEIDTFASNQGLISYRDKVAKAMQATKFIYGWTRMGDNYSWHGLAGVVMHLGSCLDLPLPTEEKLFDCFLDFSDVLGLSIHHSGDRYSAPADRMRDMANYLAQLRIANPLTHASGKPPAPTPYILHWNTTLKGDANYQTLNLIYDWIVQTANKHLSQKAFWQGLFINYLDPTRDAMLANNPATHFSNLRNRLPELAARPEFAAINQELNNFQTGYTTLWNDVQLAHAYRNTLWTEIVAAFRAVPVANRDAAWTTISNRIGTALPNRSAANLNIVNWLVDNDNIANIANLITTAITNSRTARNTNGELDRSKVGKAVYLTTISLGKGRFFDLLTRIKNMVPVPIQPIQPIAVGGAPRRLSASQSLFPHQESGLNYTLALSNEPILLNGMKVIFDESVPVSPVNLERKVEKSSHGR